MSIDASDERVLEHLRRVFKTLNRWMVLMWRLGLGRWAESWPAVGGRILVLEHVGRSSGRRYRTPLNFTHAIDAVECVAGFGERTDWYRNLMARPTTTVWLPSGAWTVFATDISHVADRTERIRRVLVDSGLAAPTFGVDPRTMTEGELEAATTEYRLVRLQLVEPAGRDPRDLRWAWPAAGAVLAGVGVLRLGRRSKNRPVD